jgi:hypothetical protein
MADIEQTIEYDVNKVIHNIILRVSFVNFGKKTKLKINFAIFLIKLAAGVLGCGIKFDNELEDD